ncbi:MAG: hypothetical protein E7441_10530 [Ruminococcaceae bacterium]|nr:hypothetical protein [Oscillospiraceae bacterium]
MQKKWNNADLQTKYNDKFIYFVQLWGELLDARTIDIYQHNILNVFLALKELLVVTNNTLNGIYTSTYNFDDCKNETKELLLSDEIIAAINPHLYNCLKNKLCGKLDSKESKIALIAQLKSSIRYLESTYIEKLFSELEQELLNCNYEKINKYTKALVSQCIDIGWSPKGLLESLRFLNGPSENINGLWQDFKSKLTNTSNIHHHIYIELIIKTTSPDKKQAVIRELNSMGIETLNKNQILDKYPTEDIVSLLKSESTYIFIDTCCPDIYSAAQKALQQISNKIYLLSFYGYVNFWDIANSNIFAMNPLTKYKRTFLAESLFKPYEYVDVTNRVLESTKEIFSSESTSVAEKLLGTFAYTNISKASMFQEARFMNMWVALESLVRTGLYKDIISNVKAVIPSACVKRYLFSIIRNFIEDCERCEIDLSFSNGKSVPTESKHEAVQEILFILKDDTLFTELKNKTEVNKLLTYRCTEIREVVIDYGKLKQKLINHHKMVSWNLQRLYRTRNGIAHAAKQENIPTTQIKHLFSYLTTAILEVVAIWKKDNHKTIDEIYCKIINDYDAVIGLLSGTRTNTTINDTLLKDGFIDLL